MIKLLYITPEYAEIINYAVQTSTRSIDDSVDAEEFVRKTVKGGRLSIGRHCMASFEVICSRACSHQLVRHTHLNYTQESQRYVDMKNFTYLVPMSVYNSSEKGLILYMEIMQKIEQVYSELISSGVPKEDARYVLPNAALTHIVISGNFQAWWDFLKLSTSKKAQWEIRNIAEEIKKILIEKAPAYFDIL
jgi:thymidylate synthase (FAD)